MTITNLKVELNNCLQAISQLLASLAPNDWQRTQGEKWTIAQEIEHLRLSTAGTAFVLSAAGRSRWYPYTGESRSFETIMQQYQTGLKAVVNLTNPTTHPTEASDQLTLPQQTENWTKTTQALLAAIECLAETDLDAYTVWKHPLLGPLTVREMIYFSIHHTNHHYKSLTKKRAALGVPN